VKLLFKSSLVIAIVAFGALLFTSTTNATMVGFSAGRIMDDAVMGNKNTMSEGQVQAFLKSKNPCNRSVAGVGGITVDSPTLAHWTATPSIRYNLKDGKFVCMADDTFNGESAARILSQAAQDYNINPQVLIVLIEKEQSLVSDTFPNSRQYASATGFACFDDGNPCQDYAGGFKKQIRKAAALFREVLNNADINTADMPADNFVTNYPVGNNFIRYNPEASCGGSTVNIQNRATSALYRYTPYQPNPATIAAPVGATVSCGAYGNKNYYHIFTEWFGSAFAFSYNGVDFSTVFDADYYLAAYSDVRSITSSPIDAFDHFIKHGMSEGRQGTSSFNALSYKDRYPDLRVTYGDDMTKYAEHYIQHGRAEGRTATGSTFVAVTGYNGVDYSSVYDFNYYINTYPDLKATFGAKGDLRAIEHFVRSGMAEGRQGRDSFNALSYKDRYPDLRAAFGNDMAQYATHYIQHGKTEGRTATGNTFIGVSGYNGVDYSLVYDFDYYINAHPDLKATFGAKGDLRAIEHFVRNGMAEGRSGRASFNVQAYKNNNSDLRSLFGSNLTSYYLHYIKHGHQEGRSAS